MDVSPITTHSKTLETKSQGPIDMHVHMVGTGSSRSGCWLRLTKWHYPLVGLMLRGIGMKARDFRGNFDELYVFNLLKMIRESSLSAAVILAHDKVYRENGEVIRNFGSFYVPNDYVLSLAHKHPEFLAAVSIHPARPDALDELNRCAEAGAVMVKLLPNCHNVDCNLTRYRPFWNRMAELGMPFLAHTGGEHTVPVYEKSFSDPRTLRLPLECGVNVIAAHCATKSGLTDPQYFFDFVRMTKVFPNLYGDTSAFNVPIRGKHVLKCVEEPLCSRILHGSDFPVPVHGHFPWMNGFMKWDDFRKWESHWNVIERDYQFKKAMGFPDEVFTRVNQLFYRRK
jgi:predicted TIM-barrel fold metal-dependent hydrolase